jgi:hypothetical protein
MADWPSIRFQWHQSLMRSRVVSDSAKVLGAALWAEYAARETGACWPRYATLAEYLGKSERSVIRAVAELERAGFIAVTRSAGRGRRVVLALGLFTEDLKRGAVSLSARRMARERGPEGGEKGDNPVTATDPKGCQICPEKGDKSVTPYLNPCNEPLGAHQATAAPGRSVAGAEKREGARAGPYVSTAEDWLVRSWDNWLRRNGLPDLERLVPVEVCHDGRRWPVPVRLPPTEPREVQRALQFFRPPEMRAHPVSVVA